MPELWFDIVWPDGTREGCYSPSTVIREHFADGARYPLDEFLARSRLGLRRASDRVQAKYGMPCARARAQLARIEQTALRYAELPHAQVCVGPFNDRPPE